jgi:hypothetical protein
MPASYRVLTFLLFVSIYLGRPLAPLRAAQTGSQATKIVPTSPGVSDVKWVKYQDPFEQAFTIDVPQGWTAKGGLFRLGYSDYRPMLDLQSPDGNINIRSGDVAIPSYALPAAGHLREGEIDDLGAQAQMVFANYRTGKEFAGLYALTRLKTLCQALTPQETDQTSPVKDPEPADSRAKTSVGAIAYRCDSSQSLQTGGSRTAYVYARTTMVPPSLWQVTNLVSYLARPERVPLVRGILMHMSQSMQPNPQWIEYQKKMDADGLQYQIARQKERMKQLGQQMREFEGRMQAMRNQVGAFQRQQAVQARQVETVGNILTGITPTVDPLNGETRNVWTGLKNGYWINGQGTVVNSNTSPGPGFRQLQP